MEAGELINPNPIIHERKARPQRQARTAPNASSAAADTRQQLTMSLPFPPSLPVFMQRPVPLQDSQAASGDGQAHEDAREPIDPLEVYEHLRDIIDPEHPYTLEQLNVVSEELIDVDDAKGRIRQVAAGGQGGQAVTIW